MLRRGLFQGCDVSKLLDRFLTMTEGYTASHLADCFLLDLSCCRRAA
jgi:hypothetical protein